MRGLNRINTRRLADSHGDLVRSLIGRIAIIEMVPPVLKRALEPFPAPVRTLDAIHLAAIEFVRSHGASVQLASYDERLVRTARLLSELLSGTEYNSTFQFESRLGCGTFFLAKKRTSYGVEPADGVAYAERTQSPQQRTKH